MKVFVPLFVIALVAALWWLSRPGAEAPRDPRPDPNGIAQLDRARPVQNDPTAVVQTADAPDEGQAHRITLGDGIEITTPPEWVRRPPRVAIIEHEFAVPAKDDGEGEGRSTVMQAGGSIEANIERWFGQFEQPDGAKTAERATVEEEKAGDVEYVLVDIPGTFLDAPGPFAPPVRREGHRMIVAIVPTGEGNYFVRFDGPAELVESYADDFRAMFERLR